VIYCGGLVFGLPHRGLLSFENCCRLSDLSAIRRSPRNCIRKDSTALRSFGTFMTLPSPGSYPAWIWAIIPGDLKCRPEQLRGTRTLFATAAIQFRV
jgi:hypothetical protein